MKQFSCTRRLLSFILPAVFGLSLVLSGHAAQFPIATNATSGFTTGLAFDGTNYLVAVQGDELAATNITAQLIGTTGALLGSRIKVGRGGSSPVVAFDGTNYLMVWTDSANAPDDDIYGQFISRAGALVRTPFPISTASGKQVSSLFNGLVFDGTNYLAVWRDQRIGPDNDNSDIYGQLITPAGTLLGSEIAISTQAGKQRHPAAAFDGTNYLTVWISQQAGGGQWDTYGRFISRAGIPGNLFLISQTVGATENTTSVAFDGTNYLVAWERDIGLGFPNPELGDIYCRFVSPSGSFPGNEFAFVTNSGNQVFPSLAFDGANYLLSWSDGPGTTNSQVRFQFLNPAGAAISSPFNAFTAVGTNVPLFGGIVFDGRRYAIVTTLGSSDADLSLTPGDVYGCFISPLPRGAFPIAITSSNEFGGSTAFDGTNYLAGIGGGPVGAADQITAQLFSPTGALIGLRISTGRFGSSPKIAFDGTNYLMVWEDVSSSTYHIYGQFISRFGTLVGSPFAISPTSGNQFFDSINHIVFDGSNYFIVWRDGLKTDINIHVYGQLVSPAGTLLGGVIAISAAPQIQLGASVGFDGTNFFVAYQNRRSGATELYDTYGNFVSRAGAPGSSFLISQAPTPSWNPTSLAFDGSNYLVVWNRDIGPGFPSPTDWDIYARLVTLSGTFVGNEFPITTAPGSQPYAFVTFDGANYLVSWFDQATGVSRSRFFNRAGVPVTSDFTLFGSQGTRSPLTGFLFDGSRLVALTSYLDSNFSNGDIYGLILPQTRLDFVGPIANGQVPLRFTGMPGVTYSIQGTSNLLSAGTVWTTLATSNSLSGTFNFTPTNAPGSSRRFYRALLP